MKYNFSVFNSMVRKNVLIDGERTVAELFDMAGVMIGNSKVYVGGKYVNDLDTTIDELGLDSSLQLQAMATVKAENAASAKVTGGACVITSTMKLEDIKKLERYAPESLALYDDDGNQTFAVDTSSGNGSISNWGATFGKHTTADGYATITLPYDGEDPAKFVEDNYGVGIYKLSQLEALVDEALAEVSRMLGDIRASISVE